MSNFSISHYSEDIQENTEKDEVKKMAVSEEDICELIRKNSFDPTNLQKLIVFSFAAANRFEHYRNIKASKTTSKNLFYYMSKYWFKFIGDKYVHVELSFSLNCSEDKLITFSITNDTDGVICLARDYNKGYDQICITVNETERNTIFNFMVGSLGKKFDKYASTLMMIWPGSFDFSFDNEITRYKENYYCVNLIIESLQKLGLFTYVSPNSISIEELYNLIKNQPNCANFFGPYMMKAFEKKPTFYRPLRNKGVQYHRI